MAKGDKDSGRDSTSEAAEKIYNSAKEVFANKQKIQYKKMLNLLKRFTLECSFENIEESLHSQFLEFWFNQVLPLLFGTNTEIRDAAIECVTALVPQLKFTKYQNLTIWDTTKKQIVDTYSNNIEKLRTAADDNWYKIWILFIQILDNEIFITAQTINIFLAVVEKGFRSADWKIRAESFLCWRVLVQVFAKNQALDTPKRIKLICIPLKSSKSKTIQIAENKFHVWWYLICQLHKNIDEVMGNVVEPFLFFCFGPWKDNEPLFSYLNQMPSDAAIAKLFPKIKQMAVVALNQFLGSDNNKIIEINKQLQLTVPAGPFLFSNTFDSVVKPLIKACVEATVLLTDTEVFNAMEAQNINRSMWTCLMTKMDPKHCDTEVEYIKEHIFGLIEVQKHQKNKELVVLIRDIVEITGTSDQFPFGKASINQLSSHNQVLAILRSYCELLLHQDIKFDDFNVPSRIIKHIFTIEKFKHKLFYGDLILELLNLVVKELVTADNKAHVNFSLVVSIWNACAYTLIDYLKINRQHFCSLEHGKQVLLDFLVWPCDNIEKMDLEQIMTMFDKLFQQILKTYYVDVNDIIEQTSSAMRSSLIVNYNSGIVKVAELFMRVLRQMKGDFDDTSKPHVAFDLVEYIVKNSSKIRRISEPVKQLVDEFMKFVISMNYKSFFKVIMNVKTVYSELTQLKDYDMKNIKQLLLQKFRKQEFINELKLQSSQVKWNVEQLVRNYRADDVTPLVYKNYLQKILEICAEKQPEIAVSSPKSVEDFAIITKVWKMNPSQLTEHQREKMKKRRADIPALYNDMSRSQDTFSLDVWAPNKVVVPLDGHQIVLLPSDSSSEVTTSKGLVDKEKEVIGSVIPAISTPQAPGAYLTRHRLSVDSKGLPKTGTPTKQNGELTKNTPSKVVKPGGSPTKSGKENPIPSPSKRVKEDKLEETPSKKNNNESSSPDSSRSGSSSVSSPLKAENSKPKEIVPATSSTASSDSTVKKKRNALNLLHIDMNDHPKTSKRGNTVRERRKQTKPTKKMVESAKKVGANVAMVKVVSKEDIIKSKEPTKVAENPQSSPCKRIDFDHTYGRNVPETSPKASPVESPVTVKDTEVDLLLPSVPLSKKKSPSEDSDDSIIESSQEPALSQSIFFQRVGTRRSLPATTFRSARMVTMAAKNLTAPAVVDGNEKSEETSKPAPKVDDTLPLDKSSIKKIDELVTNFRSKRQIAPKKSDDVGPKVSSEVITKPNTPEKVDTQIECQLRTETETQPNPVQLTESIVIPSSQSLARKSPRKATNAVVELLNSDDNTAKLLTSSTRSSPRKPTPATDTFNVVENKAITIEPKIATTLPALDGNEKLEAASKSVPKVINLTVDDTLPLDNSSNKKIDELMSNLRPKRQIACKNSDDVDPAITKPKTPEKADTSLERQQKREAQTQPKAEEQSESILILDSQSPVRKSPRKATNTVIELSDSDENSAKSLTLLTRTSPRKPTPTVAVISATETPNIQKEATVAPSISLVTISPIRISPRKTITTTSPSDDFGSPSSPKLSPIRHQDHFEENEQLEELPQLNCSNRSIISSPEMAEDREVAMLNDTLNISPIKIGELASNEISGATTRNSLVSLVDKETPIDRKTRFRIQQQPLVPESPRHHMVKFAFNSPLRNRPTSSSGRGAQFFNMVMEKQHESSPKLRSGVHGTESTKISPVTPVMTNRSFLTFSKELPARTASPSSSILKRKQPEDGFDNDVETPAQKRKRVSFLDPPVSSTKEYILDDNEKRKVNSPLRTLANRCLIPSGATPTDSPKSLKATNSVAFLNLIPKVVLTRKSRAECMMDLVKFTGNNSKDKVVSHSDDEELDAEISRTCNNSNVSSHMSTLAVNDTTFEEEEAELVALRRTSPRNQIKFDNEADVFKYVFEKLKFEELLEKYEASQGSLPTSSVRALTKKITNVTKTDEKLKHFVLAEMAEEHPMEALDLAIQENSSTSVCQRLPMNSVLDYVVEASKNDGTVRERLRNEFDTILSDASDQQLTGILMKLDNRGALPMDTISQLIKAKLDKLALAEKKGLI